MTSLILSGTDNLAPLHNVLCVLKRKAFKIDVVHLIDTPQTITKLHDTLEEIKITLGNRDILVTSLEVNEQNAADLIPAFMASLIVRETKQIPNLVVDLTTGPKYITSLLYAAANFCQVEKIYYFLLTTKTRDVPFEKLVEHKDFEYVSLPTFSSKSLAALSQSSHMDMIYYLKDLEDLVKSVPSQSRLLAEDLDQNMRLAVEDYFEENYERMCLNVGKLLEAWTKRIYIILESQGVLQKHFPDNNKPDSKKWPSKKLDEMFYVFNDLQNANLDQPNDFTSDQLKCFMPLAEIGSMLNIVREYRNIAAHGTGHLYQMNRYEAKLVLDIGFAFVIKCKQANFLLGSETNQ